MNQEEPRHAVLIVRPAITIRSERVAEVLGVSLDKADQILSDPNTKPIIVAALERSFQETVSLVIKAAVRIPTEAFSTGTTGTTGTTGPHPVRVDCLVTVPSVAGGSGVGL